MTDKQIKEVFKNGFYCIEPCPEIKTLQAELKAKEQECEFSNLKIIQLQETLSQYETDLSTKDCIVETCKAQYKELKAENDKLKETFDGLFKVQYKLADNNKKLRQTLTEIKPILEFYANSKMGEEQPDRTYKIMLSGGYIMVYDPKPARQALQKIGEVENG